MKETLRHKDAFEYYYSLGDKRNSSSVATQYKVSERSIFKWSKNFNWQDRIVQRDIENGKKLSAKTNETVLAIKANYRAEIKAQFGILKEMLEELIKEFKEKKGIKIKDVAGLKDIMGCYEKLVKMDLTLIGEVSEREEIALRDADEKLFNEIHSIVAREKKAESLRRNKKSKR